MSLATTGVLAALAIAVGVNYLGARQNKRWDLTARQQNSLSEQTVKVLQSLQGPVKFTVFDRQTEFVRQLRRPATVIEMAMGEQDFLQLHALRLHRVEDPIEVPTGIDHRSLLGLLAHQQRAVLLQRGDRNDCDFHATSKFTIRLTVYGATFSLNDVPALFAHQFLKAPDDSVETGNVRIHLHRAPEVFDRLFVIFQVNVDLPVAR